jgi:hypothetical protein
MEYNKQIFLEKYGITNNFQRLDVKEKIKKTNLQLYGVENVSKNSDIKQKIKNSLIKNGILEKRDENGLTFFEKLGKDRYTSNCLIYGKDKMLGCTPKEKSIQTCKERFGVDYYFQTEESKATLSNYIKKYGEQEGLDKYKEKCKKSAITLENLTIKYGKEEGEKRYEQWKKTVAITLEKMISMYGEELGRQKYFNWYFSSIGKYNKKSISNISKQFFEELIEKLNLEKTEIIYEYKLYDKNINKVYFYDFYFRNKIIEFNGDYWHANPKLYKHDDLIKLRGANICFAKEIWDKDIRKIDFIKSNNFHVYIIWEREYRSKQIDFEKIKEFLYE